MVRRVRRVLTVLLGLGVVLVLVGLVANVALVRGLDRIQGAFDGLSGRPPAAAGETVLMVGTRPGTAGADVPWLAGRQSVEAVMLVEIAEDGRSADVESLPVSSGVAAVVADPSPSASVSSVEDWSGRRVDHLLAIDWETFARLADLDGTTTPYTYGSGTAAQRVFLQEVVEGTLHQEMRKRPLDLYRALSTTIDGSAVDDGWSTLEMDLLVLSLRNLRSHEIAFSMAQPG